MKTIENCQLLIIGAGDVIPELKRKVKARGIDSRVKFIETVPFELLMRYTAAADIGLSLDKDTNINYRYSLPNKIFDYAMAGTAILAGDLPEVGKVIREFNLGQLCAEISPECIVQKVNQMLDNPEQLKAYEKAGKEFAEVVNWQQEFQPVLTRLRTIGKA
jgi:glycosyltransferase involved in cell wall biosynthesis